MSISIHASEKEATGTIQEAEDLGIISIHASEKEATKKKIDPLTFSLNFNPRLREGGDNNKFLEFLSMRKFQSTPPRRRRRSDWFSNLLTHGKFQSTPPRRRRLNDGTTKPDTYIFQSTPPRRRRHLGVETASIKHLFQSTPPRRRRPMLLCAVLFDTPNFNPRLREGGDSGVSMAYCSSMISIHASEKEATPALQRIP